MEVLKEWICKTLFKFHWQCCLQFYSLVGKMYTHEQTSLYHTNCFVLLFKMVDDSLFCLTLYLYKPFSLKKNGKNLFLFSYFTASLSLSRLHWIVCELFMYYRIFHYIALVARKNFNSYLSYVVTCSFFFPRLLRISQVRVENNSHSPTLLPPFFTPII